MSIQDDIRRLATDGTLRLLTPLLPNAPHSRVVYLLPALEAEVCGPWDDKRDAFRMSHLHRDLDRFSTGEHITVGHGDDDYCDLKLLDPEKDDVWEFRSRAPQPSYRLFGSFGLPDVLILTNMEQRKVLGPKRSREWAVEIGICKAEWRKLFPYYPPHHGAKTDDYISAPFTDLSDIESR